MGRKISIEANNLKKIYKNREVVKNVSLSIKKGEVNLEARLEELKINIDLSLVV